MHCRERKFIESKEEDVQADVTHVPEWETALNMRQSGDDSRDVKSEDGIELEKASSSSSSALETEKSENSNYFKLPKVKIGGMLRDQRAKHNRQVACS